PVLLLSEQPCRCPGILSAEIWTRSQACKPKNTRPDPENCEDVAIPANAASAFLFVAKPLVAASLDSRLLKESAERKTMKLQPTRRSILATICGSALLFCASPAALFAQHFSITNIVVPNAASLSVAAMNANGQVAGYCYTVSAEQRAFFWD